MTEGHNLEAGSCKCWGVVVLATRKWLLPVLLSKLLLQTVEHEQQQQQQQPCPPPCLACAQPGLSTPHQANLAGFHKKKKKHIFKR